MYLLLEAMPPLSTVLAISTELEAEDEGGDHGLLHCFSLPLVLVLLTFTPRGCRERSEAFKETAEIQQDKQEDLICPVQGYMVTDRRAYPPLPLQQEPNSRVAHNSCQEDRISANSH